MEDTLMAIIKMASSIITVIGILWFAIQYFVKYKVNRMGDYLKEHHDKKHDVVSDRITEVEKQTHALDVRVTKVETKIENMHK